MAVAMHREPTQALLAAAAVLDEAASVSWSYLDDKDLFRSLETVNSLRNQLDSLAGEVAVAAERTCAVYRADARNASLWMAANTSAAPARVRADVRRARWLSDFGEFAEAHAQGRLSLEHVEALRKADKPILHLAMVRDQGDLLTAAETCRWTDFQTVLQYWVNAVDPDGEIPAEQTRGNSLSIYRSGDGSVSGKFDLDPILGETVHNAVLALAEKLRIDDNDRSNPDTRPRTDSQRQAQALAELVAKGAIREDGTISSPLINVVMSEQVAEDLAAGRTPTLDPFDPDSRCEFLDGTPLHPCHAARLIGAAHMRRIVLDAKSRAVDVSVKTRLFPRWMKDVSLVTNRGRCTEPGCDAPLHWIHADHKFPRSKGGPTALSNVQPLCGPANRAKRDSVPSAQHNERFGRQHE